MSKRYSGLAAGAMILAGLAAAAPATAHAATTPATERPEPAVGGSAPTGTASAATWYRCKTGHVCLFTGKNGTGTIAQFRNGAHDLRDFGINDATTSVWNRTSKRVVLWKGVNFTGVHGWYGAGDGSSNLPRSWDNKIGSLKVRR